MYIFLGIILIVIAGAVFYRLYPPLGGRSKPGDFAASPQFKQTKFQNQISTSMSISARDALSLLRERRDKSVLRQPVTPIYPEAINMAAFLASTEPQLIWLGHSSVLMRLNGKTILTDPMLSRRSSPFSFIGPKRTISDLPLTAAELPPIDIVLISHDHYDHLDYATIRALNAQSTRFFVPLGVAAHLAKWGIKPAQISELDWWDKATSGDINLVCTPSRHFSGRKLGDRFKTLWCSWVIEAPAAKIYFSGDTGYGPHFKAIGDQYGPFDLTLMECGQYDTRWSNIHMHPEDTVRAHTDLRGQRLMPIHWGAFVLALHPWNNSVKRAQLASITAHTGLVTAKIGQSMSVLKPPMITPPWWD